MDAKGLAGFIDHTLLKAESTSADINKLCDEAVEFGFCAVCVNPRWVSLAAEKLENTKVKVCSVAGFPLGAEMTNIKAMQAKELIFAGADEVDMVADIAAIIEGDQRYLENDLREVLKVCRSVRPNVTLKLIMESAALNNEQIKFICQIADHCGVDFLKTSTGLHPAGGAALEDVKLMRQFAPHCQVKAAGGIRTAQQAMEFIEAGATRIGTSAGPAIIKEMRKSS
ncbi:MAG: deoxyribose-phosphate aldolase [Phycisphaerae bacterium]|nr:deoxyribose-phosphate aldolase [Phycisphaerae bacterium]